MNEPTRILIVEDTPADAELAEYEIRRALPAPLFYRVETREAYLSALDTFQPDLILSDYSLPRFDGMTALKLALEHAPLTPVIIFTGSRNEDTAVACLKAGATDYVIKDRIKRLNPAVLHALQARQERMERQRAEELLRASREHFRLLATNSPDTVFYQDRELKYTWIFNPAPGISVEQVLGKSDIELLPEPEAQRLTAIKKRVLETGQIYREEQNLSPAGQPRWYDTIYQPVRDETDQVIGVAGYARDITERKYAEQGAQRRAEELTALQATVLEITTRHELHPLLRTIVERAARLLCADGGGLYLCDPERRQARCVVSYNTPTDYTGTVLRYGEGAAGAVALNGKPLIINDYRTWSGRAAVFDREQPFRALLSVPMFWHGQVTGVIHVLRYRESEQFTNADLDLLTLFANHAAIAAENARLFEDLELELKERKQAEQALRASEARFATIFRASPIGICLSRPADGQLVDVNDAFVNISGYSREELIGHTTRELNMWAEYSDRAVVLERMRRERILSNVELKIRRKSGELGICLASAELIEVGGAEYMLSLLNDVTDRKLAEAALRASETRYRLLFESAPVGILLVTPQGQVLEVNPPALEILGSPSAEQTRAINLLTFPPLVRVGVSADLQRCVETAQPLSTEITYTSKWGKTADLNYFMVPILDADGKPTLVQILVQDITERKRAEQALRASEQRYRRLFEENQAGVYYTTLDGRILDCNDTFAHILGYASAQEIKTHPALDLYFDAVQRAEFIVALQAKGTLTNFGLCLRRRDGTPVWVLENVSLVLDENGAPLHIQGTMIDVTERKRAEERLRASEEKFRAIAEQMLDTLFVTDLDGALTYVSPSAARTFGWQPAELVGHHFSDFLVESDIPKTQAQFRSTLETGAPTQHFQARVLRKNAAPFWGELSGGALVQNGQVVGTVGLIRDITDALKHQREIEAIATVSAALRAANARAEIVSVVVEHLVALLDAEVSALLMRDPASGEAVVEAARGALAASFVTRMPRGAGLVNLALHGGESCYSNHSDEFPQSALAAVEVETRPGAIAAAPLIAEKQVIGALWLARKQPIAEGDMRILTAIADIAASALQRASLYEQTVVQLERMDALHHIDTAIASSFDLPLTLNILLGEITTRMGVDAAAVLLLNPHTMVLEYAATRGFRSHGLERQSIRLGNGIAGRVAMERQVLALANFQLRNADNPDALARLLETDKFVAYLGIPLIVKAQVKGVLELYHRAPLPTDAQWLDYIQTLAQQAAIAIGNVQLLEDLQRLNLELGLAYDATIEGWSRALDMRDQETEGHTLRVTDLTVRLARKMGLSESEIIHIRRGALLHDIGKMGVPDSILLKQGPLTAEEWEIMRLHPQYAYDMLVPVTYLLPALDIPYFHHERWDGSGYPRGLEGDKIPLAARIFAVVDVWDAVTSDRPYRAGWSQPRAREYLRSYSGKLFDPLVVDAFLAM